MQIFKFGGASVKDAGAVRNVRQILEKFGSSPLLVVISAMGKTTNALEEVLDAYWNAGDYTSKLTIVRAYHFKILEELFTDRDNAIWNKINDLFAELDTYLARPHLNKYDVIYDHIISHGEILSTCIVSAYLNSTGFKNQWVDARDFIVTDDMHREARVDWDATISLITGKIPAIAHVQPIITQGFIGRTKDLVTTTLGREGSDFTASVFAYSLNASELVIWKDVPGVLNADPKKFPDTVKFDRLSYHDAVEMTYYGASVLHPKTIKPLQNKNIPLQVRSFINPEAPGTLIFGDSPEHKDVPIIISKDNQALISLSAIDYSFIAEENIEKIFDEVVRHGIKVNVMQNSAISFMICIDNRPEAVKEFVSSLEKEFAIAQTTELELLTIKYPKDNIFERLTASKKILLELRSGDTVQYVLKHF